jgi:hypothetical protein
MRFIIALTLSVLSAAVFAAPAPQDKDVNGATKAMAAKVAAVDAKYEKDKAEAIAKGLPPPVRPNTSAFDQASAIDRLAKILHPQQPIKYKKEADNKDFLVALAIGSKLTQQQIKDSFQVREYTDIEKCKDKDGNQFVGMDANGKLCGTGIMWTVGPDGGWVQGMEINGKSAGMWRASQIQIEKGHLVFTKDMYNQALKKMDEVKSWAKTDKGWEGIVKAWDAGLWGVEELVKARAGGEMTPVARAAQALKEKGERGVEAAEKAQVSGGKISALEQKLFDQKFVKWPKRIQDEYIKTHPEYKPSV